MKKIKRNCPICTADESEILSKLSHPEWSTVQCNVCEMIYLNEAPDYASLSEDIAWTKQFCLEKKRRKNKEPIISWLDDKTRWRLHLFRNNEWAYIAKRVKGGNVLDVGCGSANNIPTQFTPFGIEIEREAARTSDPLMQGRGGYVIHAPAIEGLTQFEDGFFDGIIMRSFLEHEAQPREVLAASYAKLKPGGTIYVKVPNFDTLNRLVRGINWCGFRFPDHLNYFGINTIQELATLENFKFHLVNKMTRYTNDNLHCFLIKSES